MKTFSSLLLGFLIISSPAAAQTQGFPSQPLRMVVGFGPGGGNDILARILSRELGSILGQPVVVENRPGAGGIIGADNVAKAQPNGYSLYLGSTGTNTIAPALYAKMPFDPRKDLAPVAVIARAGNLVMVNNDLPVKNIGELIALAKKKPGTLNFGSSGNGSTVHLAGALFAEQAGIDIVHVPYKGDAQALSDLIAGQVQIGFSGTPPGLPFAKSGQARVLAVTTPNRSAALPDVPTVAEAGLPGYSFSTWYGLFATGGTDPAVIGKLSAAVKKAMDNQDVRTQIQAQGVEPSFNTPQAFAAEMDQELVKWKKVVKTSGITIN